MSDTDYVHVMRFNVSQDEYDQIVDIAKNHNMSISDYCRYALLNELYFDQVFKKIQEENERIEGSKCRT